MAYELDCFMTLVHFCSSNKEFRRVLKKLDVTDYTELWVTGGAGATTHHFRRGGWRHEVICMGSYRHKLSARALLAHECMHAVQGIRDQLNGGPLSDETECWLLQSIFQNGMEELRI